MRKKYTYIPNSEIESITTWNGKEIKGDKLLDGAYAKGNVKYAKGGGVRKRYTYIPNSEIESLRTWNDVEIPGDKLLDGAYAKGNVKYAHGGVLNNEYFMKQAQLKGGIDYYSVDVDTETGEQIRDYQFSQYNKAKQVFEKLAQSGIVYSHFSKSYVNIDDVQLMVIYKNGDYDVLEQRRFNEEDEFERGGMMKHGGSGTVEQQAQEMIGDAWYQMTDEQRASSVADFVIDGYISSHKRFEDGGTIREEFMYILEEHQPNVDFYETVDDMTIFSNDADEIEAIAIYLRVPQSKIKFHEPTGTYFIQIDKDGNVMAKGGAVKDAKFVVTFTVDGKKIKKTFKSQSEMDDGIADFYINNLNVEDMQVEEVSAPAEKPKEAPIDVFASAKEEKKKSSKKDDKDRIEIPGIEEDIIRLNQLKAIEKNAKAEAETLKGKIKELARDKFIEKYEEIGRRPENFKVFDGDADILFIVQDNYITVSPEKADLLRDNYPELLGEKVSYKIAETMLKKRGTDGRLIGEIISDLIGRSRDISDEDKANLFTITKEIGIVEGAIEKLADYDSIPDVYNLIQPIEALK